MKKIIGFLSVMLISCACFGQGTVRANARLQSQKVINGTITNISYNDTTLNTDTTYLYYGGILGWNISVQWNIVNVTGTAGATTIYQGSPDNVNWYVISTDTVQCNTCLATAVVSGLTSAATVTKAAIFKNFPFANFRARTITSGTQTSYLSGKITEWSNFVTNLN